MTAVRTVRYAVGASVASIGTGLYGVACSGGADSMTLADAAIEFIGATDVVLLIIDHGINPRSAEVAAEVAAWARGRGAAAVIRRVEVKPGPSIEAAARTARYAALEAVAEELGLCAILIGHTARDQAETVLMRLLRGTGPAGLAGIPWRRVARGGPEPACKLVRPLLWLDRSVIDDYVAERALPTWPDPMNADLELTRVRVREVIMPWLREENPQLDAALLRVAASANEWLEVIDSFAVPFARFPIACRELAAQPPAIRKRAVALALEAIGAGYETAHLEAIDHVIVRPIDGEVSVDVPGGRFVRSYDEGRFEPRLPPAAPNSAALGGVAPKPPPLPEGCALRVWQAGDRMRPARLKGKSRKLSDLFVDGKVPRASRAGARVIERVADHAILWAEYVGIAHDSVTRDEERQKLAGLSLIWPA